MGENELKLQFRLIGINTKEFAVVEDDFSRKEPSNLGASVNFGIDEEKRAISVDTKFQFEQKKKPFLIISVRCGFELGAQTWTKLFNEETNNLLLPQNFASHLAVITVGTTRGVLHEKTNHTPFNAFMLPLINLTEMIKGDVSIKLGEKKE